MQTLPIAVWNVISAGALLPSFNAEQDLILPKEMALGTALGILAMYMLPVQSHSAKGWAFMGGFALGWMAIPGYIEARAGFPHFKSANNPEQG